jgi:hypothetical protein
MTADAEPIARPRRTSQLAEVLARELGDAQYRTLLRPMLCVQLVLYVVATLRLIATPTYAALAGTADPLLHENHLGNIAIVHEQPRAWLLAIHMGMALVWVAGIVAQKHLVARMARALAGRRGDAYALARRLHALLGSAMILVAIAGCLAGPAMAWHAHGHLAMQLFLLSLPCFFLPAIAMTWISARRRAWAQHRFWATVAFVGPGVSSLWAEALIYVCGRLTPLGPYLGELVGTASAFVLGALVIVVPAWRMRAATTTHP